MSYDGRLGFGLLADFDAVADLEDIATDLERSIAALARAAGVSATRRPGVRATRRSRPVAARP
jgi:hypothetical protein